jgi:hypothetical protein
MNDIVKKGADLACDVLDSVGWLLKKMESPGRKIVREDARGATAEVSVPIKAGKTGEIIIVLGETYQHYPAKGANKELEFAKGAKVRVQDVGSNMMYIEPIGESVSDLSSKQNGCDQVAVADQAVQQGRPKPKKR